MSFTEGMNLLEYAMEKEKDRMLYDRWIVMAQNFQSFDEFKKALTPPEFKPEEELFSDVENILTSMQMG